MHHAMQGQFHWVMKCVIKQLITKYKYMLQSQCFHHGIARISVKHSLMHCVCLHDNSILGACKHKQLKTGLKVQVSSTHFWPYNPFETGLDCSRQCQVWLFHLLVRVYSLRYKQMSSHLILIAAHILWLHTLVLSQYLSSGVLPTIPKLQKDSYVTPNNKCLAQMYPHKSIMVIICYIKHILKVRGRLETLRLALRSIKNMTR